MFDIREIDERFLAGDGDIRVERQVQHGLDGRGGACFDGHVARGAGEVDQRHTHGIAAGAHGRKLEGALVVGDGAVDHRIGGVQADDGAGEWAAGCITHESPQDAGTGEWDGDSTARRRPAGEKQDENENREGPRRARPGGNIASHITSYARA